MTLLFYACIWLSGLAFGYALSLGVVVAYRRELYRLRAEQVVLIRESRDLHERLDLD